MLGYSAYVYEIAPGVGRIDFDRIREIPYQEMTTYVQTLTASTLAYVPYRTWVDHLLKAAEEGRARLLHDGGYPYLFDAPGGEIKSDFEGSGLGAITELEDARWYLVEAWDQS